MARQQDNTKDNEQQDVSLSRRGVVASLAGLLGVGVLSGCGEVPLEDVVGSRTAKSTTGAASAAPVVGAVAALDDLRHRTGAWADVALVAAFAADGTVGGGAFVWHGTSAAPADDGGVVIVPRVTPAPGYWRRVFSGPLDVTWFGARGRGVDTDAVHDTRGIQRAINALPASGGEVLIPAGKYIINACLDMTRDNLTIRGQGKATILRAANQLNKPVLRNNTRPRLFNLSVKDLQLDGNRRNQDPYNEGVMGICVVNSVRGLFEGLYIHETSKECLSLGGSDNHHNKVKNCSFAFASSRDRAADSKTSAHIWCQDGTDLVVEGCDFEHCTDNAVGFNAVEGVLISDCHFLDTFIIAPGASKNIRIVNNDIRGESVVSDVIVGKFIMPGAENIVFSNNHVHRVGAKKRTCIYVAPDTSVKGFVCTGNTFDIPLVTSALELKNCSDVVIADNVIRASGGHGFNLYSCERVQLNHNTITNPNTRSDNYRWGIIVNACSDVDLTCNTVMDARSAPLMFDGIGVINCAGVQLRGNRVRNATRKNVHLSGNTDLVFSDNVGFTTADRGQGVASGTGLATTFTFPHGCAATPSYVEAVPASAHARGDFFVSADATEISISYATAPPPGASNLRWYWKAEV